MSKSKTSAFFSLLVVFLSGALVGGLGFRYYSVNYLAPQDKADARPKGPRDPVEVRRRIVAEMRDTIKLTPDQVTKVESILDTTRDQFKDIQKEMNEKGHDVWQHQIEEINAVLTPEQRPLYQQLRDKHQKEREERRKKHGSIQQDPGKK
jgi:hypothetical protein